jgi:2-polyprenyl-3-methyl-5-hydroxy-6-metoxy-1,4-benzoquinol methylase
MGVVRDLAGKDYWDALWADSQRPILITLGDRDRRRYLDQRLAHYLHSALGGLPVGAEVLEVGCARSPWLPFAARELSLRVTGLDYSQQGCELEREVLRRAGVEGEVVCADLFDPPANMLDRFAAVMSFGVVEHFEDTARTLAALARFLAPGGMLITQIPNLTGLIGVIVRATNRPVYDMHVSMTAQTLAIAHEIAGLRVADVRYLPAVSLGHWHLHGLPDNPRTRALEVVRRNLGRLSYLIWAFEMRVHPLPATRALSPYVICRAHLDE